MIDPGAGGPRLHFSVDSDSHCHVNGRIPMKSCHIKEVIRGSRYQVDVLNVREGSRWGKRTCRSLDVTMSLKGRSK